jgi:hypothetical protein
VGIARAPNQARMGAARETAPDDPTPAKATASNCQQKRDPPKGRLHQGITIEYSLDMLANPLRESLIRPEA